MSPATGPQTAAAYEIVALEYQARFGDELNGKPRDRKLLDAMASRTTGLVLDVGSGPGQIGGRLRSAGRPVVGLDLSHSMASLAKGRLDGALVADMRQLPVATGAIADLVAFYSVIHLPRSDLDQAVVEFSRALVPGGHVLLSAHEGAGDVAVPEFLGHEVELSATFFTLNELTAAARHAGLEVVSAERRPPYSNEGSTVRLYVEAAKPASST